MFVSRGCSKVCWGYKSWKVEEISRAESSILSCLCKHAIITLIFIDLLIARQLKIMHCFYCNSSTHLVSQSVSRSFIQLFYFISKYICLFISHSFLPLIHPIFFFYFLSFYLIFFIHALIHSYNNLFIFDPLTFFRLDVFKVNCFLMKKNVERLSVHCKTVTKVIFPSVFQLIMNISFTCGESELIYEQLYHDDKKCCRFVKSYHKSTLLYATSLSFFSYYSNKGLTSKMSIHPTSPVSVLIYHDITTALIVACQLHQITFHTTNQWYFTNLSGGNPA